MATASGQAPSVVEQRTRIAAVAQGADYESVIGKAPFIGTVAVSFVPDTILTGANTDSRDLIAFNRGAAAAGTTVVATQHFLAGTSIAAQVVGVIPASVVAAATDVAAGDVITLQSNHVGAGLAMPAGMVLATFTRS